MWVSKYVTYLLHHSSNIDARRMVQILFENHIFVLVWYSTTAAWCRFYNVEVVERLFFGNLFCMKIKDIHVVYLLYKFKNLHTPSRRQRICIWIICFVWYYIFSLGIFSWSKTCAKNNYSIHSNIIQEITVLIFYKIFCICYFWQSTLLYTIIFLRLLIYI